MELFNLSINLIVLLFFVAVLAGFIDVLAGGGGLITIPALIFCGVPPLSALGTNKLQGSIGTLTSTFLMRKKGVIRLNDIKGIMLFAFLGATIGAIVVQSINTEVLSFIIPVVLTFIAIYFFVYPVPNKTKRTKQKANNRFTNLSSSGVGVYDGMFGPGTGAFFTLIGLANKGGDLVQATGQAKALNLSTNLASLIVFIIAGKVVWVLGFFMLLGQVIGAWLGARCLFKISPHYLRGLLILCCLVMLVNYFIT